MSKNICPSCKGKSEYLDCPDKESAFLCTGCEIKHYFELRNIMKANNCSKEDAYRKLQNND